MAPLPGPSSPLPTGLINGLGDTFSVVSSLANAALPVPDILTKAHLSDPRRFDIWKNEVWTYLRILSMLGQLETRTQHPIKRPLTKWEHVTQAYIIRRLISVEVKVLLPAAKLDIDANINESIVIMDHLERLQGALQAETESEEGKSWEEVDKV